MIICLTFTDKNFNKVCSFRTPDWGEKERLKIERFIQDAINKLNEAGISNEDIRIIDWENKRLFHLKDFSLDKLYGNTKTRESNETKT